MLDYFAVKAINLLLKANPNTQEQLTKYATKIIRINLPFLSFQFLIDGDGSLEAEQGDADCAITIPLSSASYVLHQDELRTYKSLEIDGDKNLAKNLLEALATIETTNVLYLSQNPLMNMFAAQLEKLLVGLVDYAKMVSQNAGHSISQYVQYENGDVVDKYDLEQFSNEVDEVKSRYELLLKRVERISQ